MNTPRQIQTRFKQAQTPQSNRQRSKQIVEDINQENNFILNGVSIQQVEEILEKYSQLRNEEDIQILKNYTKHFPIFKKYNKDKSIQQNIQQKCLKYMKLLIRPKNQHIFTENEKTKTRLYFILKGSVSIYTQTSHMSRRSSLISMPTRRNSFMNLQSTKKLESLQQQGFSTPKSVRQQQIQNLSHNISQLQIESNTHQQLSQSLFIPRNQVDTFSDIIKTVEDEQTYAGKGENTQEIMTPKIGNQNKSRFYKSEQRPSFSGGATLSKFHQLQNENTDTEEENNHGQKQQQISGDQTSRSSKGTKKQGNKSKQNQEQYQLAEQMNIFGVGMCFGKEISDQNYQMNMYACCQEDCVFGYLDSKDYKNILEVEEERLLQRKCQKLRKYKTLSNCSNEQLKQLLKNMTTLNLIKKQNLYQEGDFSEFVYLFQKGQIILKKRVVVNEAEIEDPWRENEKLIAMRMFQQKNIELAELNPYDILGVDEIFNSQQRDLDVYHQNALAAQKSPTEKEIVQEDDEQEIIHDRYLSLAVNSETAVFKVIKKDYFKYFAKQNNLVNDLYKKSDESQSWINKLVLNFQQVYALKKQYMIQLKQGDRDPQLALIENHLNEKQKKENIKSVFFLIRPEIQMYQRIKRVRASSESESDKRIRKKQDEMSKPVTVEQNFELHQRLIKCFTKKKKDSNEKELRMNLFVNSSVKFYRDRDNQRRQTKYQSTGGIKTNQSLNKSPSPKNKSNASIVSKITSKVSNNRQYHSLHNPQTERDHNTHKTDNSFSQKNQNTSRGDISLIQLYKNQERAYTPSVTGRLNLSNHKTPVHLKRPSSNTGKSSHHNMDYLLCSDLIKEDTAINTSLRQFEQLIRSSMNHQIVEEEVGDFTAALMQNEFQQNHVQNTTKTTTIDFREMLKNKKIKSILNQIYDTSTVYKDQNKRHETLPNQDNEQSQGNKREKRAKSVMNQSPEQNQELDKNYLPSVTSVPEEFFSQKQSTIEEQHQKQEQLKTTTSIKISSQNLKIPLLNDADKLQANKMRSQLIMKQLDLIKQKTMQEKLKNRSKDTAFNSISVSDIKRSIRDDSIEGNQKLQHNLDKLLTYFDHQQQTKQSKKEIIKSSPSKYEDLTKKMQTTKDNPEIKSLRREITQNNLQNIVNGYTSIQQQQFKLIEKICPHNPMIPLTKLKQQKYIKSKQ